MKINFLIISMLSLMIVPAMAQLNVSQKVRLKQEYRDCVTDKKSNRYKGNACINFRNGVIYAREFEVKVLLRIDSREMQIMSKRGLTLLPSK